MPIGNRYYRKQSATSDYRKHYGTWERSNTRASEYDNTNTTSKSRYCNHPFSHTGATHSLIGMIDYLRFQISEMHLGKFPDSLGFQSWKVNFKSQVCSKPAVPHFTMHWIKRVEIAKSTDDITTSQSTTGRRDFPDCEMLDAMIASALKKLLTSVHFRMRVIVEEQRAQILTREAKCIHDQ